MKKKKVALTKKGNPLADPKKLNKLSKAQLVKVVQDSLLPFTDPDAYKERVKSSLPVFVKEIEALETQGTAVFEASQEMMLVIFDCLRRYHGLKDEDLKRLNKEITDVLQGVKEFEAEGLSMLSMNSVRIVGDNIEDLGVGGLLEKIARVRMQKAGMEKAGIEYPKIAEKPFTRRLKK